ncbi:glycosyltransferase [Rhizobium yanglingense]
MLIFYDRYGYDRYDFVAQFDADHVPEPTYLQEVMKPFADPRVGYVSAPSICDRECRTTVGPQEAGFMPRQACMVRCRRVTMTAGPRSASARIMPCARQRCARSAGSGRSLAEDHSTTMMMNAGGWRGVHALDAIAHGDGPATFADLVVAGIPVVAQPGDDPAAIFAHLRPEAAAAS